MGPAGCTHFLECYPVFTTIPVHLFSPSGPCSPIVFPLPAQVLYENVGMQLHPLHLLVCPPGLFPASLVENLATLC